MPEWIHNRAEHLLAKNPDMKKETAFAVATQQAHAVGKSPKSYGTARGRRVAKAKFDTPKDDVKKANPGGLDSPKLAAIRMTAMRDELLKIALADLEKDALVRELGQKLKELALTEVPGTKKWIIGRGEEAAQAARKASGRASQGVRYPVRFNPNAGVMPAAQQGGAAFRQAASRAALAGQRRGDILAASMGGL